MHDPGADHGHDHGHDHDRAHGVFQTDHVEPDPEIALMEAALRELLIEKGVFSAQDLQRAIQAMEARGPAKGAAIVARAWTDPEFRHRLLTHANSAVMEFGVNMGLAELVVLENTRDTHNLVVCTLCSCYPRALLGIPPSWYKTRAYRSRVVREPRTILEEFGLTLPPQVRVRVHDSTADLRFLVLPQRPASTQGWDRDRLASLVTRDSLIGVARALEPETLD
jgi:nitrile hydratase alpha subunit